ncbi:MAG: carboxypeptidase regulatory-like domain-containing protein [Gemmatimonas sp.]
MRSLSRRQHAFFALLTGLCVAGSAAAQTLASRPVRPIVFGIVHDSVARAPLAGAIVQLVATDSASNFGRTVVSDSGGQFGFGDVPDGRYTIGFFHPMLDSLGLEPMLRAVSVTGQRAQRTDLAVPSPARIRAAVCGSTAANGSGTGAVVLGVVRDAASGAPHTGAMVAGEWSELSFGAKGITSRSPRRVTTTGDGGWFALCNVPSPGTMLLIASRGADSTDRIEVQMPADGFLRRELFLGATRGSATRVVASGVEGAVQSAVARVGESATNPVGTVLPGGRLSGVVVALVGGAPLSGAQVSIANGPQTRANERGEWTLLNAPLGTRTVEVRAVGHYPERRSVDVVPNAPPLRVAMATLKSVLETVKVSARAITTNMLGFQERRRTAFGRFLTEEDIIRKAPNQTSELFRSMPGLMLYGHDADGLIKMRGIFEDECDPVFFLNGSPMRGIGISELDQFVMPREISGVEIYQSGTIPAQFQTGATGCGAIVFWTTYGRTRERRS